MKFATATAAALAATALMTTTAAAGEYKSEMKTSSMQQGKMTKMVKTIDADGEVSTITVEAMPMETRKTAVLGALAVQKSDAYVVQDQSGELFINHLVPVAELPDPTLNVREIETYTTEYRGMVFTNRVTSE